jgi:hypothetical protein
VARALLHPLREGNGRSPVSLQNHMREQRPHAPAAAFFCSQGASCTAGRDPAADALLPETCALQEI